MATFGHFWQLSAILAKSSTCDCFWIVSFIHCRSLCGTTLSPAAKRGQKQINNKQTEQLNTAKMAKVKNGRLFFQLEFSLNEPSAALLHCIFHPFSGTLQAWGTSVSRECILPVLADPPISASGGSGRLCVIRETHKLPLVSFGWPVFGQLWAEPHPTRALKMIADLVHLPHSSPPPRPGRSLQLFQKKVSQIPKKKWFAGY